MNDKPTKEFLDWYKQQPIDFTSKCEFVRAAIVWNKATDSSRLERLVSDDFGERVAHIIVRDMRAHDELVELCNKWHRNKKNSMYIDFEQSVLSYKAAHKNYFTDESQNSR